MHSPALGAQRYKQNEAPNPQKKLREELVDEHGALVRKVARRIMRRLPPHAQGFEEEDLVSIGIIGLFDAHERYEPDMGYPFATFAEFRIKGAILDELRRHDFFPRRLRVEANKLNKATDALTRELGRKPTEDEIAEKLEIGVEALRKLKSKVQPYTFVDEASEAYSLRSPNPNPYELVKMKEMRGELVKALATLPDREKLILDLMFNHEYSGREIAELMEISEGRVSQLKKSAIDHLRAKIVT